MIKTIILESEETCVALQASLEELGLHVWYDANGLDTPRDIFYAMLISKEPIPEEAKNVNYRDHMDFWWE